jgi:hypothetical protein
MCFSYDQVFVKIYKCNHNIAFLFKEKLLVKPMFKMESDQDIGSYHPITLVSAITKILEEKENP